MHALVAHADSCQHLLAVPLPQDQVVVGVSAQRSDPLVVLLRKRQRNELSRLDVRGDQALQHFVLTYVLDAADGFVGLFSHGQLPPVVGQRHGCYALRNF